MTTHQHSCQPLGTTEVARLLGVEPQTVKMWRVRGVAPPATWVIGGRPVYCKDDLVVWARQTGRLKDDEQVKTDVAMTQWFADGK